MQISRLRVGNEDFLVASMIDRCPKSMMLRELVKNALEAAANAADGGHRVEISPRDIQGARKLAIWNTGPGMDATELHRMCDIASSIGKSNALDQNFGMGAKVASLPSNHHGIRYRSNKAGRVHQVLMGKRDDIYGRLHQTTPPSGENPGQTTDVLDVTAEATEDHDLSFDWTEVVLLGNRPDQDTVANPYDGSPAMSPGWIAEELYARFHTLPENIDLILRDGCNTIGGDQNFVPIARRAAGIGANGASAFAHYEAVKGDHGTTIHYYYDAPDPAAPGKLLSARGALQPALSTAALIYRGEFYDVRPPHAWQHEAPIFGLPFGARHVSIHVELPDDFPLLPDGYRQFLRYTRNLQHNVHVRDFSPQVLRRRPAWLLKLLENLAPDARHTAPLHDEMRTLFRHLRIRRRFWPPGDGRHHERPPGDGEPEYEVAPQIVPLRDEADIAERGIAGKAARFYPETHQLFVNTAYPAFTKFAETLAREHAAHDDQEQVRRTALTIAEQTLIREICRKLVFALGKRGDWHNWEVDQALSMYSLTLAADDHDTHFTEARAAMAKSLGSPAAAPPPDPRLEQARARLTTALEDLLALRHPAAPLHLTMRVG